MKRSISLQQLFIVLIMAIFVSYSFAADTAPAAAPDDAASAQPDSEVQRAVRDLGLRGNQPAQPTQPAQPAGRGGFGGGFGQGGFGQGGFGQGAQGAQGRENPMSALGGLFNEDGALDVSGIQSRVLNVYKKQLGITDEEWQVILPRFNKVVELTERQESIKETARWNTIRPHLNTILNIDNSSPMGQMVSGVIERMQEARSGMSMTGGAGGQGQEEEAIAKATRELQETLAKEAPSTAEIKAKIAALRGAQQKEKKEMEDAQKELKEVLTVKQEAMLLLLGMLE